MPRKPSNDDPDKPAKSRVRFIFEPDRSSPNGVTYSWLIHRNYKGKEKAATAARAFWLPFAYKDTGKHSEAELKDLARQSIIRMEEQIQHLRETFGIEPPSNESDQPDFPAISPMAVPAGEISLLAQDDLLNDFSDVL
ncbi:hypothetical protein SPB21_06945 [Leptothoe sp. ISB3NOV94-8A]